MMRKVAAIAGLVTLFLGFNLVRGDEEADKLRGVLDRAIAAHGGADNLKKASASVTKTKSKVYPFGEGLDYTIEVSQQFPDRLRIEVESNLGDKSFKFIKVVKGDKGWTRVNDKTTELDKEARAETREQLNAAAVTHLVCLTGRDYTLSPLGEVNVGDHPAVGIRVERNGYRDVSLFFDKEKHYLVKMESRGKEPLRGNEEFTAETFYSDYKKIDGMLVAHKITIKRDGKLFVESETTDVKMAEKLDDSVFEKP